MIKHRPIINAGGFFLDVKNGSVELGQNCPFCCQKQCDCLTSQGAKKTALENIREAVLRAKKSQKNTGGIEREDVMDWILANVQVTGCLIIKYNGDIPYLEFIKYLPENKKGEYLEIFAFGANEQDKGDWITGILQLRRKKIGKNWIYYFRLEKVGGVHSDADLVINAGDNMGGLRTDLPIQHLCVPHPQGHTRKNLNLDITIGFSKWVPSPVQTKPAPIPKLFNPVFSQTLSLPNLQE